MSIFLQHARRQALFDLRSALRDGNTLVLILGPLLLYPLLLWALIEVVDHQRALHEHEVYRVAVEGPPEVVEALSAAPFERVPGGLDQLQRGELDGVVTATVSGDAWSATVHHASVRPRSVHALEAITAALDEVRSRRLSRLATAAGLPSSVRDEPTLEAHTRAPNTVLLQRLAALLVAFVAAMGGSVVSVAISAGLLAGERAGNTLQTLLLVAAPRRALLLGKLLAGTALGALVLLSHTFIASFTVNHAMWLIRPDAPMLYPTPATAVSAGIVLLATAALIASGTLLLTSPAQTASESISLASLAVFPMYGLLLGAFFALATERLAWVTYLPTASLEASLSSSLQGEPAWAHALWASALALALAGVCYLVLCQLFEDEDFLLTGAMPGRLGKLQRGSRA